MKKILSLLLILAAASSGNVHAAASCSITSSAGGTLVNFGTYSLVSGDQDSMGQITLLCVPDVLLGLSVSYSIAIGSGGAGVFSPRRLSLGGYGLNYNLYRDPARTQIFGDGSAGTAAASGSCTGACAVNVHGRIFGGQLVPGGTYRDDVVVTLSF